MHTDKQYPHQGDIHWVELGEAKGFEEAGTRPCIIISGDDVNKWCNVVMVVPLTSNMKHRTLGTHVPFIFRYPKQSLALCEHTRSVDRSRIGDKIGYVPRTTLRLILSVCKDYILRERGL